jgi:Lysophospholipase L1 and related esterases
MEHKYITIYIVGDSTAATKKPEGYPEAGWGETLHLFFNDRVKISNHAQNGRSSRSFFNEGRLKPIMEEINEGDFLLIQFGHNDEKDDEERHTDPDTSYKTHLMKYVDAARERGAFPILITPVNRRSFDENGLIINTHLDYWKAVKALAESENVPIIDLCEKSRVLYESLGDEKSKELFLWVDPGQYPGFPDGRYDNTHFNRNGATEIAKLIADGIRNDISTGLKEYLK